MKPLPRARTLAVTACLVIFWVGFAAAAPPFPWLSRGDELPTLAPLLEKVTPAVVNIAIEGHVKSPMNPLLQDPFFRRFFNVPEQPRERQVRAAGSGVVIDAASGRVITNYHVIQNADEIKVTLHDGRRFKAKVVGSDSETDIAVLELQDFSDLHALPLGDSDKLRVGDFVIAIGNPFALGQTVTSGIVSGLGRSNLGIEEYEDFIQTDASINPGNSGGALVNLKGELIGINTAIVAPAGGNVGIGFAIPINMAHSIERQIVEHGDVKRGQIGVTIQNLTSELAERFGVKGHKGALVSQVLPGSPADKAGLQAGDVIVAVNDQEVLNTSQLRNRIGLLPIGTQLGLSFVRDGNRKSVKLKIGPRTRIEADAGSLTPLLEGAGFRDMDSSSPLYGEVEGVQVASVERQSRAWSAGLRVGDIVLSVNRKPVHSVEELRAALDGSKDRLLLHLRRGNGALFVIIQ